MEHQDLLFIIAEIAAVLAGFSAVILAVRIADDPGGFTTYTFTQVIQRSLAIALLALLPALINSSEFLTPYAWQISSALSLVHATAVLYGAIFWWNALSPAERPAGRLSFWWRIAVGSVLAVVLMVNIFLGHPFLYMLQLFWLLVATSLLIHNYVSFLAGADRD